MRICLIFITRTLLTCFALSLCQCTEVITKKNPNTASDIFTELAFDYMKDGHWSLANIKLNQALQQNPQSAMAHYAKANYLIHTKNNQAARVQFEQALDLSPNNPDILNGYAIFLCQQKHYSLAQAYFHQALKTASTEQIKTVRRNMTLCNKPSA